MDWQLIKSLSWTFGPILISFAWGQYQKIRVQLATAGPPRPLPAKAYNALTILFIAALAFVVLSFPYFQPDNLFTLTQSRLQTPQNVLFERLRQLRPNGQFSYEDDTLSFRLQTAEARALYFKYGPEAIVDCVWCQPIFPTTYTYYLMPEILGLHMWNILALGLATSSLIAGPAGSRWRYYTAFGAVGLALGDVYYLNSYPHLQNLKAATANDIDFFYWRMRTLRPLTLAAFDAGLATVIWLASTGRFFNSPLASAEKVSRLEQQLMQMGLKTRAAGVLQNTISRSKALQDRTNQYWEQERQVMDEVMAEPAVVQAVNRTLKHRLNKRNIEREASDYSESLIKASTQTSMPP